MKKWVHGVLVLGTVGAVLLAASPQTAVDSGSAKYLFSLLTGKTRQAHFGSAVLGAIDWVGTGKKYIAVGASGTVGGPVQRGAVYFYDTLTAEAAVITLDGVEDGDLFGRQLSGTADMNGDGLADLAVSAPYGRTGPQKPGKVYLFLGGKDFSKSKPIAFSVKEAGNAFGLSVCLEKDLNGDGLADLVVGAPYSSQAGPLAGRAYIWWGSTALKGGTTPDVVLRQGTTNDMFGTSLAVGDLNGDGQADLAVGAPQHNVGDKIPGSVFIYLGGGDAKWARPSLVLSGEATTFHDHFGASVAILADVNGDGAGDLLVGAPKVMISGPGRGRVYLYWGGPLLDENPDQNFDGEIDVAHFGAKVCGLGDLNQDGKSDFAIQAEDAAGARGILYFYYGGWERSFYELRGEFVGDRLGNSVVPLGDMDANGTKDVAVGARWNDAGAEEAGRVYILSFPD